MKVIALVLSFVCISSARNIKWSPEVANEIEGDREIKEQVHIRPQLVEALGEMDEQTLKELLHQLLEIYRPIHETSDENLGQDIARPLKPFTHQHFSRPLHDGEGILNINRPLDGASSEIFDQEIVRPFPQKHLKRPLHTPPADVEFEKLSLPQEDIMILLPAAPAEVDVEIEKLSLPQKHIMLPQEVVSGEIDGETEKSSYPHNYIMRPQEVVSGEINGESEKPSYPHNYIMRPLNPHPAELDEDTDKSFSQEAFAGGIKDQGIMKPFSYECNKRPLIVDGEKVQLFPQENIMRPLYAQGKPDVETN